MGDFFPMPTNVTNMQQLLIYNNTVTNDLFGISVLLIIFTISFISMIQFDRKPAFVAAMWLTAVVSVFLWVLKVLAPEVMIAAVVITALGSVFLFRTREN